MPSSKFVISTKVPTSFRAEKVKGMFDVDVTEIKKEFDVAIPIEGKKWNVGLIVGSSGSGKTTIAKRVFDQFDLFSGFEWSSDTFLDDFDDSLSAKQIVESLSKVGFASPPDWLKPFSVLSNGQKMRAELARVILESERPIIYDEFTSVVDRQVAQIGSAAIQKFIRKEGKQFIAVSCHYDIESWLEPDWVYDASAKEFKWGSLRRPGIEVQVRRAQQDEWGRFAEFHYMNHEHNAAAHKYIAEINGEAVAWCSVLHLPNAHVKNMKRIHRLVVKPDYQGIGIGNAFLNEIASRYKKEDFRVTITTSSPALIFSLKNSKRWAMTRKPSRMQKPDSGFEKHSHSAQRLTASLEFLG